MKLKIEGGALLCESLRLALLGVSAGYVFVAFFYVSNWVSMGGALGWNPIVNNFWGVVRNLTAALFFYPAIGFVVNFVTGALTTLVTGLIGLDEERRWRVGVIVVGVIGFAILGLPFAPSWIFTRNLFAVGYAVKLVLGAGFVWVVLRWERVMTLVSRCAAFVLAGAAALWLLFVFVFQGLFSPNDSKTTVPPGPNVVIILSDAHRADVDSLYDGDVPTPNLERLAALGVAFEYCFAPSSWTVPSVTAMFTGLAPEVTGMDSFVSLLSRLHYLPEQLSAAGYRTWAMMGNPLLTPELGFSRGFDHYAIFTEYFYGQGFLDVAWSSFYNAGAFEINRILKDAFYEHTIALGPEDSLEMLHSLNPAGGDFVYIHLFDPHAPYRPPERYRPENNYEGEYKEHSGEFLKQKDDLTDEDVAQMKLLYEGEVRLVDEYLGEALDILDTRELWENTVVVFCADHGEEFAEHGMIEHFNVNLQHELTHVPLVIYWPGLFEGGGRFSQSVGLADVYVTILDGLGIEYNEKILNGRSLLRPLPEARPVFAQRCKDERHKSIRSDFVVRDEAALFVNYDGGIEELYLDYYANGENVAEDHLELVTELKELLASWHERNEELIEHYGTGGYEGTVNPAQLERLRALGYLQ